LQRVAAPGVVKIHAGAAVAGNRRLIPRSALRSLSAGGQAAEGLRR
jgi:hypothetical protein